MRRRAQPARALLLALGGLMAACGGGSGRGEAELGEAAPGPSEARAQAPTFAGEVAPIIHAKCATCHHEGGPGPFALVGHAEVRDHGEQILEVTHSGFMPPWLPEPGPAAFAHEDERRLSPAQQRVLDAWVEAGMPEGDASQMPATPRFEPGWQLGEPQLVLEAAEVYALPAEGGDIYRNFVIPVPASAGAGARYVSAVELLPGPQQVVHHAVMRVDLSGEAQRLDAADPEPGFDGMVFGGARMPGGRFIGWTPGKTPELPDPERAWQLAVGSALVVQVHLRPTGKPESIRPRVGLHLSAQPPRRPSLAMVLSSSAIDIAPGDADFRVQDRLELPAAVLVHSVYPHAHYVGKHLRGYAILPSGERRELIEIRDWDFNWQDAYRFVEPQLLPAGTVVHMDFRYDNSAANPRNPASPPQRVRYGPDSSDEMAELILELEPVDPATLGALDRAFMRKWLDGQIAALERRLASAGDGDEPEILAQLGALLARSGRLEQARQRYEASLVRRDHADTRAEYALLLRELGDPAAMEAQLDAALQLEPDHARAHLVRANTRRKAGAFEAARESYARALGSDPDLVEAHNNLGITLEKLGRPDQAAASFARAVELAPGRALFHQNHGRALETAGRYDEALRAYHAALQRNGRSLESLRGAAWILATHPDPARRDPGQARKIAELGVQATEGRSPELLEALAAAHAAAGQLETAQQVLRSALELAEGGGHPDLATRYRKQLARLDASEPMSD